MDSPDDDAAIGFNEPGLRQMDIRLEGNLLTVVVDEQTKTELEVQVEQPGALYLCSEWGHTEQLEVERQNLFVDDVYDAVFREIVIQYDDEEQAAFSNVLEGADLYRQKWMTVQNTLTDWFAHMA